MERKVYHGALILLSDLNVHFISETEFPPNQIPHDHYQFITSFFQQNLNGSVFILAPIDD